MVFQSLQKDSGQESRGWKKQWQRRRRKFIHPYCTCLGVFNTAVFDAAVFSFKCSLWVSDCASESWLVPWAVCRLPVRAQQDSLILVWVMCFLKLDINLCDPPWYQPASKPAGLPLGTLLVSELCHGEQQMRTCPKLQYFLSHLQALWTSWST